jgi:hypothetical protein
MSKPSAKCVFCGGDGVTKGHVWPDWLNKILPRTPTHHEEINGELLTFTPKIPVSPQSRTLRQGQTRSRRPRNTCRQRNGGWMSTIEGNAIQFATPLIQGESVHLAPRAQQILAAFLCLITMRLEFLEKSRVTKTQKRLHLKQMQQPPTNWKIWIARFVGNPDDHNSHRCSLQLSTEGNLPPPNKVGLDYCNAETTTIVLGNLCAHLFSSAEPVMDGYEGISLTRIWPLTGHSIRSDFIPTIDGTTLIWLQESFARETPSLP